jgi:hypothetical protein
MSKRHKASKEELFYNEKHPYGVLPLGNAYFCTAEDAKVRPNGLGPFLRGVTDEALIEVLGYLSSCELAYISACSRVLYVYAHHTDLWRDLTLRRWERQPIQFVHCWKETFMATAQRESEGKRARNGLLGSTEMDDPSLIMNGGVASAPRDTVAAKHVPMAMKGIYSNLLHRAWSCHTCDLATACPGFFKHEDVERRQAGDLSIDAFRTLYEEPNKPVIITGAVDYWPAMSRWSFDFMRECESEIIAAAGGKAVPTFRATSATAPVAATFTLSGYHEYLKQAREEAPLYLFDRDFVSKVQRLAADYDVPKYFRSSGDKSCRGAATTAATAATAATSTATTHAAAAAAACAEDAESEAQGRADTDLFRVFGPEARPDHKWLICGPKRSGSIFHIDPNCTNAWNVSVQGRKKWIFYPPHVHPPGVLSSTDGADVTLPISTGEWLLSFWRDHLEARLSPDPADRPLEAIVGPGDIVFVPHKYWHMVVNLDDCIALTQNYVSSANLSNCLRFLRDTPDQISGVRDRANTVDPDSMYEVFLERLLSTGAVPGPQVEEAVRRSRSDIAAQCTAGAGVGVGVGVGGGAGDVSAENGERQQQQQQQPLVPTMLRRMRKRKIAPELPSDQPAGAAQSMSQSTSLSQAGQQGPEGEGGKQEPASFSFGFSF